MGMTQTGTNRSPIGLFLLLSWLHMLTETYPYLKAASIEFGLRLETFFHLLAWTSYSFLYLLPVVLLMILVRWLFPGRELLLAVVAVLSSSLCLLFIHTDQIIYDLYHFHFNGFVLNLITTPGGIESLGSGDAGYVSAAGVAVRILLVQVLLWVLHLRFGTHMTRLPKWHRYAVTMLLLAMMSERVVYGVSDIQNNGAILDTAYVYPLYKKATFKSLARKFGITVERKRGFHAKMDGSHLNYPIHPVNYKPLANPPNIVMLVSESLRADRLTPEIMPNVWRFAGQASRFTHHYSSGNGTRAGLFGMFYGLSGSSWANFVHAEHSPLLMDRIQQLGYQLNLNTCARFSYPEFDKTLFARVSRDKLHDNIDNVNPWRCDENTIGSVIDFMQHRDPSRPFMSYMFFESTHAHYYYPEQAMIRRPVAGDINYTNMSRENLADGLAEKLKNGYTNAAHWVDMQMGRVLDELKKQNLLDNTIVVIAGDHGEEFMENGFWGHNSTFVDEQVRTPMVVWMPGKQPGVYDHLSSHMDVAVTLMQALGASNDPADYALGRNLFDTSPRDYVIVSDWHSIGVVTDGIKYRIPYNNKGLEFYEPTHPDDSPLLEKEQEQAVNDNQARILAAMQSISRFSR